MKRILFIIIIIISSIIGDAQSYAPAVGFAGSTAMYKDSSVFIDWAKDIEVYRSYQNIAFPENGYVSYGTDTCATGVADGNPNVVSLGDGGSAVLKFNYPVVNGDGFDFAVFENGFFENDTSELAFLELAFVEISTDGIEYIRFPAVSELQTDVQIESFENINAGYIHNFAGKYTMFYGTPFDLDDIADLSVGTSVNINEINFVKIIDVIGTIDDKYASYDSEGNKVNDPYPTAFSSGGFDLDAVGVINNSLNSILEYEILIIPNPVKDFLSFKTNISDIEKVEIFSVEGKLLISTKQKFNVDVRNLESGIYILKVLSSDKSYASKFIK
ncbi:MAG: T9SS type A sorting domain-containing protein [Bacteroidales bacterium]|nr:T9SS type A sorting domain-containing protein [Bacteroidales bacterium]